MNVMKVLRFLLCVALFAILPVCNGAWAEDANGAADGAAKTQSKIVIGKETSRITEPLDAEGYPDYVAAINERLSEGVTKDNNAAVLLVEALGPEIIEADTREEALKRIGVSNLPEKGRYIVTQEEMIKRWQAGQSAQKNDTEESLDQQFTEAQIRPGRMKNFRLLPNGSRSTKSLSKLLSGRRSGQGITFLT